MSCRGCGGRSRVNDALRFSTAPRWEDPRPVVEQYRAAAVATPVDVEVDGRTFGQRIAEGVLVALIVGMVIRALKS